MRYALAPALVLAALSGGCASDFTFGDLAGGEAQAAPTGGKVAAPVLRPATAPAPAQLSDADRKKIICDWAKAAGMADLKTAMLDSGKTKREIAGLHGAYAATCPQVTAAAAGPPAVPMPKGAAGAPNPK